MRTLWDETVHQRKQRRKRNIATLTSNIPYSITDGDDCEVLGHTEGFRDLAGCTTCLDCGAKIFCPQCVSQHPTDPKAVPILCSLHEERKHNNAV